MPVILSRKQNQPKIFILATRGLTPRMCGVGDAMMTGTNADTGTNPDREYRVEIAARPRRPYHAFVSSCSRYFASLFQFSRVDSCDRNATFCQDVLLRIDIASCPSTRLPKPLSTRCLTKEPLYKAPKCPPIGQETRIIQHCVVIMAVRMTLWR